MMDWEKRVCELYNPQGNGFDHTEGALWAKPA